jgi:hypothetical protein
MPSLMLTMIVSSMEVGDMERCIKTGAYVALSDYNLFAPADVFCVGDKRVVRFNGNVEQLGSFTPERQVTHVLYLNNLENYWRKDLGIAVVDESDLVAVNPLQTQTHLKENA